MASATRRTARRLAALLLGTGSLLSSWALAQDAGRVRPAACAGQGWYPADPAELRSQIDAWLAQAATATGPPTGSVASGPTSKPEATAASQPDAQQPPASRPLAIISPHAGYRYCGPVAAAAYARLRGATYARVIVLAFSHRYAATYRGVDVPKDLAAYATPLGNVPIDRPACDRLLATPGGVFGTHANVDGGEHSLELQLPYLQRAIGDFRLVPLLVGVLSEADCTAAAQALLPLVDDHTLLVASSDFTHFGASYGYEPFKASSADVQRRLADLADQAAKPLLVADYDGFMSHLSKTQDTICGGHGPIPLLLRVLSMRGGASATRTALDFSGRQMGDWTNSVTYQSFLFVPRPGTLGSAEREALLRLARQTVSATAKGESAPKLDSDRLPAGVRAKGACFVTLEKKGELRGCIGNMVALGPLCEAVQRNAVLAAARDPRFPAVAANEVDGLHIEISYLTPMKRIASPDEVIIGRHGLFIVLGGLQGVLLPQVAYERGWTRAEFLKEVCYKAGLPPDAWQRKEAELSTFEAEVFAEAKK